MGDPQWVDKLRRALAHRRGVRLGEATVASRQVHTIDSRFPAQINVLAGSDAGAVFYGRSPGQIVHLDVFHAIGQVDHRQVADLVTATLGEVPARGAPGRLADYVDVQTGTGGGRITGSLEFGQRPTLLASHMNHVHLALLMADQDLHLLVRLVAAVERAIRGAGLQTRRVEAVCHPAAGGGPPLDLSPYMGYTDSLLRDPGRSREPGEARTPSAQQAPAPAQGSAQAPSPLELEERLQQALALARRLGSPDEVAHALSEVGEGRLHAQCSPAQASVVRQLEDEGLVRREGRQTLLTERGTLLEQFLRRHLREVKLRFRKLVRRAPRPTGPARWPRPVRLTPDVRYGPVRGCAPAQPGAWLGSLAVIETVQAAVRRGRLEQIARGGTAPPRLSLTRADVQVELRSGDAALSLCLLIDASASMAGRRILAAKHLVRHLVLSTHDRISVVAFQEREVRVQAPFTRDYQVIEAGLARIQPMGLTPLAQGLVTGLELIKESRVRRPLLLLVTDGIPTVPRLTLDPLADALEAARLVARGRIPLGIIGLQPSRRYLEELARAAGGSLHVVEELDADALVSIAHRERVKRARI